ncbi:long-chain fatty acid--CoA ligase [Alicyclobacillus curvatus]|nr:long-chain fatty acid--CoA ligase [Alicyclobacillus curvatus]
MMMNVVQLLRASVVRNPQHPCLRFKVEGVYRDWTYQEVWDEIVRFAASLKARGVQPGDKVAIMAESSEKWTVCDFAIMAIGAVVVPIYPSVTPQQAAFILQNADIKCLIVGTWPLAQSLDGLLPDLVQFVVLLEGTIRPYAVPVESFDEIQAQAPPPIPVQDIDNVPSDATATIVHTSGTSGTPKGVILSHRNLTSNIEACLSVLTVKPDDVTLSYLPLSHIFERTVGHFCLLTAGGTISYAESLETIQQDIAEIQPTVLVTVPRLLEKVYAGILQKIEDRPKPVSRFIMRSLDASVGSMQYKVANRLVYRKLRRGLGGNLRAVVSGGAGLSGQISIFYQRAGIPVCEGYGMTETAPVIAVNPLDSIQPGTVGKPLPNVDIQLAEDGELLVKGPNVMSGYYGNKAATAETIDAKGWLHTGDIAELVDGYIRIVERKKNILVLATGKNVAPYPIENAITLSPFILEAVLVGDQRKYVACLIVPDFQAIRAKLSLPAHTDENDHALISNLAVRRLLQEEIQQAVVNFADFEQPKRAALLTAPFSIEGGDLTPTLKVKAKVVLQKYQREIEDVYEGIRYLDIYGSASTGLVPEDAALEPPSGQSGGLGAEVPAEVMAATGAAAFETGSETADEEVSEARIKKRYRPLWVAAGAAAILILGFTGLAYAHRIPPSLNLLGTLRQVHHNNNQINQANNQIVGKMGKVENLSSLTPKLATQLQTLGNGLKQQNANLATLKTLSQDEIGLSQQFAVFASKINSDLGSVSGTTASQSATAANMSRVASRLNQTAGQLEQTNQQIAGKLSQANSQTQTVSQEVP